MTETAHKIEGFVGGVQVRNIGFKFMNYWRVSALILIALIMKTSAFAAVSSFQCDGYAASESDFQTTLFEISSHGRNDIYNEIGGIATPLSKEETAVIRLYTEEFYKYVNPALRTNDISEGLNAYIKVLCSSLTKLPTYQGAVLRVARLDKKLKDRYQLGTIVEESAFTSTALENKNIRSFLKSGGKGSNVSFKINTRSGRDISAFSEWKNEHEILIPAGAKFKVTGRTVSIWPVLGTHIELDEI